MDQELELRAAQIEARLSERFERKLRRTRIAAGIAGLALIVAIAPMVVLAATFGDVPNTNAFYTDIDRVSDAGIAAGCGSGNYCPKTAVTREQMAAFLSRSGGRIGVWQGNADPVGVPANGINVVGTVTIKAGNVAGGTAFVHILANATLRSDDTTAASYPKVASFNLREQGQIAYLGDWAFAMLASKPASYAAVTTATFQTVIAVPTGVTKTYELVVDMDTGSSSSTGAYATITAAYFPFSEDGDNGLAGAVGQPVRPLGEKP